MATEDTMENLWGVQLITLGGSDKRIGRRTLQSFDNIIKAEVPGFQLQSIQMSGTYANSVALNLATDVSPRQCLIGMGCYVGGDPFHQNLSSSGYSPGNRLSLPRAYNAVSPECQAVTVPLPYHVPCKWLDKRLLIEYETRCLRALHERLLFGLLQGRPYKALFLEYILGGNGGELTKPFLECLGRLLQHFGVTVVVDEILTGARVGPSVTMTTNMPEGFVKVVGYITLGKFPGCGLVLKKKPTKPTELKESPRGMSTNADCSLPSKYFEEAVYRLNTGLLDRRRKQVLKVMKLSDEKQSEHRWGHGLLIFTSFTRYPIVKGLRNRLLPRLEESKLKKLTVEKSEWNRSKTCKYLLNTGNDWLKMQQLARMNGEQAFIGALVEYVLTFADRGLKSPDIFFRPEDVSQFMGVRAESLAASHHLHNKENGKRSNAKPLSMVKRAILSSIENTKASHIIYKKRKGNNRTEYTVFNGANYIFMANSMQPLS